MRSRSSAGEILRLVVAVVAAMTMIYLAPFKLLAIALAALAVIWLVSRRTQWLVLALLTLGPLSRIPYMTTHSETLRLTFFGMILILWLARKDLKDFSMYHSNPFNFFFGVFGTLIAVNLLFTSNFSLTLKTIYVHLLAFGYYYFFLDYFRRRDGARRALMMFIGVAAMESALAAFQYFVLQFKVDLGPFQRLILPPLQREELLLQSAKILAPLSYKSLGTFFHPNVLGIFLSLAFPAALALVFALRRRAERAYLIGSLVLLAAGIFTAGSRGCFLSAVVSTTVVLAFFWRRVSVSALLVSAGTVAAFLALLYQKNPLYFRTQHWLSYRDIIWGNGFKLFLERPLSGFGMGTFFQEYLTRFGFPSMPDYIHYSSAIMESGQIRVLAGFHAHNLFLHYAVEMGVLGFCLMVVFYALSMRLAWCVWRLRSRLGVVEQGVAVAGAAILWGSLAQSFFEAVTLFYEFTIAIPVAMILAAVVHCTQNTRTGRSR